jgi:hypothetical protein
MPPKFLPGNPQPQLTRAEQLLSLALNAEKSKHLDFEIIEVPNEIAGSPGFLLMKRISVYRCHNGVCHKGDLPVGVYSQL